MKEIFRQHKNLLPVIILALFSLYTIYYISTDKGYANGEYYYRTFSYSHFIAFTLVVLLFIVYYFRKPLFKWLVVLTVILGLFNIANFNADTYTYTDGLSVGVNDNRSNFNLTFQPLAFIIGITYLIFNFKNLKSRFTSNLEKDESLQNKISFEKIEEFKMRYLNFNTDQLQEIIKDKRYTVEAKAAAEQVIKSREVRS